MNDSFDTIGSAFAFPATVTVADENPLAERVQIIEKQVVDDPVAEITGKDFPLDRLKRNEANTRRDLVFPVHDFFVKPEKLLLVIELEFQSINGTALVLTSVEVSLEKVSENIWHRTLALILSSFTPPCHSPA